MTAEIESQSRRKIPVNSIREGDTVAILSSDPTTVKNLLWKNDRRRGSPHAWDQIRWWQGIPGGRRPRGVPLLFHLDGETEGEIGWLSLAPLQTGKGVARGSTHRNCRETLKSLSEFLGQESPDLGVRIELHSHCPENDLDGSSASLAVLLDWVFDVLGLSPNDQTRCPLGRWVASGGWSIDRKCFIPVEPEVLASKARAALRWGYDTLILVEGQKLPKDFPTEIRCIELPEEPIEALLTLLEQEEMTTRIEEDLSKLPPLLKTIRAGWINNPSKRFAAPPNLVNTLHEHAIRDQKATLQILTADILCRHAFHSGSDNAFDYLSEIRENIPKARILDTTTSNYFRHEWHASHAEGLVDLGYWDQNEPPARELWQEIEHHSDRQSIPDWDIPGQFGIFALNNMISFRDAFVARVSEQKVDTFQHLNNCYLRRSLYQDLWSDFWDCHRDRYDTYPERQGNLLIELWWSARIAESAQKISQNQFSELQGQILSSLEILDQHTRRLPDRNANDFDLLGRWTRAVLEEDDPKANRYEVMICKRAMSLLKRKTVVIEAFSPLRWGLERTCLFGGARTQESRRLLEIIRKRDLESGPERGMANIVKARTLATLAYTPEKDQVSQEVRDWVTLQEGRLAQLADRLLQQNTHMGFIECCPY